jgi:hypothetical protein
LLALAAGTRRWSRAEVKIVRVKLTVAILSIGLLVAVAFVVWRTEVAIRAEKTLHAVILVCDRLKAFVDENERWPESWDELLTARKPPRESIYAWPSDIGRIREVVSVDFSISVEQSGTQDPDFFAPVKPIGPCFENYRDHVRALHSHIVKMRKK